MNGGQGCDTEVIEEMSRPDFCPPSCAHQIPNKDLLRSRLPVVCPVGRPTAGYRTPSAPTRYLSTASNKLTTRPSTQRCERQEIDADVAGDATRMRCWRNRISCKRSLVWAIAVGPVYIKFAIRIFYFRGCPSSVLWGGPRLDIAPPPHRRVILAPVIR